jgi:hypothetical protein
MVENPTEMLWAINVSREDMMESRGTRRFHSIAD